MNSTSATKKARRIPWRKLLLLSLLTLAMLVLLLAIGVGWHHFHTISQIEAEKQQIAARGEPVTVEDLRAEYALPEGVIDQTDEWIAVIEELALIADSAEYDPLPLVDKLSVEYGEEKLPLPGEPWENEALTAQLLSEAKPSLERLLSLVEEPPAVRYRLGWEEGFLMEREHILQCWSVVQILSLRAYWQVFHDEPQGAAESLIAMLRVANTLKHEPDSMSQHAYIYQCQRVMEQVTKLLPHANWNQAQLLSLQQALLSVDNFHRSMQTGLEGERVLGHQLIADPELTDKLSAVPAGWMLRSSELYYLQYMETMVTAFEHPHAEASAELQALGAGINSESKLQTMRKGISLLIIPSSHPMLASVEYGTIRLRAAATLVACERYRLSEGRWPQKLAELVPTYMEQIPLDPMDEKPLRYRVKPKAIVVYSIGYDLIDDQGTATEEDLYRVPDIIMRRELLEAADGRQE